MEKEKYHLIKIVQQSCENESLFQEHNLILNQKKKNTNGMNKCRGRIQGDYPIYIPKDSLLAEKLCKKIISE